MCFAGALTTLAVRNAPDGWTPSGLVCGSGGGGYLFTSCQTRNRLYAVEITTGIVTEISGVTLHGCTGLALHDAERVLYAANRDSHQITSVELDDRYFVSNLGTAPVSTVASVSPKQ